MILKRKRTAGITYADNGRPEAIRAAKRPRRPKRPRGASPVYEEPQFNVVERLLPFLRQRKKERHTRRFAEQQARFEEALAEYEEALREWTRKSREADRVEAQRRSTLANEQKEWANKEKEHKRKQRAMNAEVNALRRAYANWDEADGRPVEEHARLVLKASSYPDWITIDFELGFNPDARTLMVEYRLPQRESMPTLRSVAYVQSRDDLKESHIPAREQDSLYENICYQIALRTIHELYEADEIKAFDAVVFNGWLRGTNPATGKRSKSCIMSVQAMRREFLALNLKEIDPKACFRSLKGVSAAKLATFTPVQPILRLDTGDRRFVESRDIAGDLSDESNLAAMDWESFEHLVRELFEQEFVTDGGEVKVTQASRDGGVDAIAFDPDPIRGGKYVIQAKRYTRTVDVSAVRDLYGTVMHEGADRGILVTTSDYGADSVNFVKDKPLTLINGAQLLSLLEKHGHRARIDLNEARTLQAEQSR